MNDSAPLSIVVLFENADIVVKGVLLLLLGGSVWSWAVIMDKIIRLRVARRSARIWARRAADARTAKQLVDERISVEANHPARAVLAVAIEESMAFDNEPESIAERRECIDRPMRLELGTQLHQTQLPLPFLATLALRRRLLVYLARYGASCGASTQSRPRKTQAFRLSLPGIADALFATAMGLAAAIPAVVARNKFTVEIGRFSGIMQGSAAAAVSS